MRDKLKAATGRTKKRALAGADNMIQGPTLTDEEQLISAWEVSDGKAWYEGLNKCHWEPRFLEDAVGALVAQEIDEGLSGYLSLFVRACWCVFLCVAVSFARVCVCAWASRSFPSRAFGPRALSELRP